MQQISRVPLCYEELRSERGSEVKKVQCDEISSVQWQSASEVRCSAEYMKVLRCRVTVELACLMCSDGWDTLWVYYVQVLFTLSLVL